MILASAAFAVAVSAPSFFAGMASVYGWRGDRWDNGRRACRAALSARLGDAGWRRALARGVAHRTLPCGTRLLVVDLDTGRAARVVVVDRGPYGQVDGAGRWAARSRLQPGARWRGVLDCLPEVAESLGLRGLHRVAVRVER